MFFFFFSSEHSLFFFQTLKGTWSVLFLLSEILTELKNVYSAVNLLTVVHCECLNFLSLLFPSPIGRLADEAVDMI